MKYLYYLGLIITCLLFAFCKKDKLEELEINNKNLQLIVSVEGVDSIVMLAEIKRETPSYQVKEGTAFFTITGEKDTTVFATIQIENEVIKLLASFPNAGVDNRYQIQAFAELEHLELDNANKEIQSVLQNIKTKDIQLETAISIKPDTILLTTAVIVEGVDGGVKLDRFGHKIIFSSIDTTTITIDTLLNEENYSEDTILIFKDIILYLDTLNNVTYQGYAILGNDSLYTEELLVSLNRCLTNTTEVDIDYRPDKPTIMIDAEDGTLCNRDSITLSTDKPTSSINKITYNWYNDIELIGSTDDPIFRHGINVLGKTEYPYSYSVTILDGNCESDKSAPINITSINLPKPNITIQGNETTLCNENSIKLSTQFIDNVTYKWYNNNTMFDTTTNDENLILMHSDAFGVKEFSYSVAIMDNGCESEKSQPINIKSIKLPELTLQSDRINFHEGDMLHLWVDSTNTSVTDSINYDWVRDLQAISNENFASYTINSLKCHHTGTYKVRLKYGSSCPTIFSSINITVSAIKPVIEITVGDDTLCAGETLTLTSTVSGQWYRNESLLSGSIGEKLIINNIEPRYAGKYYVKTENVDGCQSESSNVINVAVNTLPDFLPTFTNTLCIDSVIVLNNFPYELTWESSTPSIIEIRNDSLIGLSVGNPIITITDKNSCKNEKELEVKQCEEKGDNIKKSNIRANN